ncbi:hypothetical protein PanWU01x14_208610 [Parasponia andersonii]|uniref:Uncharacterized protein n=1 Tax=Parasponia andersonii TaxID=3476 RepID=A0A2P5BUJ6_PARAD|nr:hypothetical protein PanWU01x14_208610 [Parasponia andersonii]
MDNYNFEVEGDNASLINSLLNTFPCAFLGIASMNINFLILLYGATYRQYFNEKETRKSSWSRFLKEGKA